MIDNMHIGVLREKAWGDDGNVWDYNTEDVSCLVQEKFGPGTETKDGAEYPIKTVEIWFPLDEVLETSNRVRVYSRFGHVLSVPQVFEIVGEPKILPGYKIAIGKYIK
jgi:hypothetical protein